MSRIRSIHPDLFTDEAFVEISFGARLLLLGLGTEADDQGVFQWKPTGLRLKIFPGDPVDVQELLTELVEVDFVRRYVADDGREFGCIRNFCRHQKPKRPNAKYPIPPELFEFIALHENNSLAPENGEHVWKRSGTCPPGEEGSGEESSGGEGSGRGRARARKAQCPEDFWPSPTPGTKTAEAMAKWTEDRLRLQVEKFINHHRAKGNLYADWQRAWSTWVLNDYGKGADNGNGNNGGSNGLFGACTE